MLALLRFSCFSHVCIVLCVREAPNREPAGSGAQAFKMGAEVECIHTPTKGQQERTGNSLIS